MEENILDLELFPKIKFILSRGIFIKLILRNIISAYIRLLIINQLR